MMPFHHRPQVSSRRVKQAPKHTSWRSTPADRPLLEVLESRRLLTVAFQLGSAGVDTAHAVAADAAGNLYVAGSFNATVDFDTGPGAAPLTAAGTAAADAFVAKYTADGQLLWVGHLVDTSANAVAVGGDGSVVVTGGYKSTTDFDFGPASSFLTNGSSDSAYVAKYTSAGDLTWARRLGGTSYLNGDAVTVDAVGNVYSSGTMSNGTADLNPGAGTFTLTNTSGNADSYVAKLDASGNFVWAGKFTNDPSIAAGVWTAGIDVDAAQNVYLTGIFVGRADFDPGPGTQWRSTSDDLNRSGDGFVAKLTAAGNLAYIVTMGSSAGREDGNAIAVDDTGNAYVTGQFTNTMSIVSSPSAGRLTSAGSEDIYVMRLNPAGSLDWARRIGSAGFDGGLGITADASNNLYLTGYFNGTVDFDSGAGTRTLSGGGGFVDAFILKLRTDATFVDAWTFGGANYEFANGIAVTPAGEIAAVGRFTGSGDFNPTAGITTLTSAGSDDAFVTILSQAVPNRAPVAADGTLMTGEDVTATGDLAANDPDGDSLTHSLVSGPSHGTITITDAATGAYTYVPAANFHGTDSFTYRATDGAAFSNVATVTVTVSPVNDPPSLPDATFAISENTPVGTRVGTLRGADVDGDTLTYSISGPGAAAFAVDPLTGVITIAQPAPLDFESVRSFTFVAQANDGAGASATANVRVDLQDVLEIAIDVLPGDPSNQVNLRSKEIEVAVLGAASFDPLAMLDFASLQLLAPGSATAAAPVSHHRHGYRYEQRDVNGDQVLDLVLKFKTADTGLAAGDTSLLFQGELTAEYGGQFSSVEQAVSITGKGNKGGGNGR